MKKPLGKSANINPSHASYTENNIHDYFYQIVTQIRVRDRPPIPLPACYVFCGMIGVNYMFSK